MAYSGGRDTRQQQELLQRHYYHHNQRQQQQQQQQQQQHVDLPRVPQDRIRDWDHTSTLATPCDPRPRSRHHRHHAGGAVTLSNQLTEPKEVKLIIYVWLGLQLQNNHCMYGCWIFKISNII